MENLRLQRDIDEPPPSSPDESDSYSRLHTGTDLDPGIGAATDMDADEMTHCLPCAIFGDDEHAVHMLPALMESPGMFGCVFIFSFLDQ